MGFRLRITEGKGQGREFYFRRSSVKIGRMPDNDLILYDTTVSRHHCQILRSSNGFRVRDTGSANGILVNDVPTVDAPIDDGDRLRIGPVTFEFSVGMPAPGPRFIGTGPSVLDPEADTTIGTLDEWNVSGQLARAVAPTDDLSGLSKNARARLTPTGSYMAYHRRWRDLPRAWQLGAVAGVLLILAAATGSAYLSRGRRSLDRSEEVFVLGPENAARSFGSGKVQVQTPDHVKFLFVSKRGRAVVTYAAGGIESPEEVAILLNGARVADVPTSPGRWASGLRVTLPRQLLREGANILTFENRLTPGRQERWGIAQVQLTETPLPAVDEARAAEYLALGQAAMEARSVTPHNLARAIEYFGEGRRFLEAQEPPSELLAQLDTALREAETELQGVFDSHVFAAEKAARFGETEEALESLRQLLEYFPNQDDARHREIKERLQALMDKDAL